MIFDFYVFPNPLFYNNLFYNKHPPLEAQKLYKRPGALSNLYGNELVFTKIVFAEKE